MKYILVQNQTTLLLGPFFWNRYRTFQSELNDLYEDGELTQPFLLSPDETGYVNVGDGFEIFPVVDTTGPEIDSIFEQGIGPTYVYSNNEAIETWSKKDRGVLDIQNDLISMLANNRYYKECAGTTVTIQGATYNVSTDRASRPVYAGLLQSLGTADTINYKINGVFLNLTGQDIQNIIDSINAYIQTQFDWEKTVNASINNATTVDELKAIVIT